MMFLKYEFSHTITQVYINYRFESFCIKKLQSGIISTKQVITNAQYQFSLQTATNHLMRFFLFYNSFLGCPSLELYIFQNSGC